MLRRSTFSSRDRCCEFLNGFAEKFGGNICVFLLRLQLVVSKKLTTTLVAEKNVNFFRRKLAKIAENCYHNIDLCFAIIFRKKLGDYL
jgi:hypothetical protein